mgnify:CR=1 FL=1|tara:strand:- start:719 stop:958 length:240 start_codon:yes stop_codon:yes gene_type:complete
MAHPEIRRAVTETRLKTIKLADSNKWKVLNKELILDKTVPARALIVELKEESLKITRKLDFIEAVLYRHYYRNAKHSKF